MVNHVTFGLTDWLM